jgi:hypothetical protein
MIIRTMNKDDIPQVENIERVAWGDSAATTAQITQRSQVFPTGSIVVEINGGKLIGYASAQLVNHISNKSWSEQTDKGSISGTHIPHGQIAYGVSMSALPEGAKYGVAGLVISHYQEIFIASGMCSILCLGSRLPGFGKWHRGTKGSIRSYLSKRTRGFSRDPELRLYEKNGFQLLWEIESYYPDEESLDFGAMIVQR